MLFLLGLAISMAILGWLLQRLFPAAFAAGLVVLAPLWLVLGWLHDVLRLPLSFLRPVGAALARVLGFIVVVPMMPFIFAWSLLSALRRRKQPPGKDEQ